MIYTQKALPEQEPGFYNALNSRIGLLKVEEFFGVLEFVRILLLHMWLV